MVKVDMPYYAAAVVYPVVVGYTKGCRVVHPTWYCWAIVVYGCGLPEQQSRFTAEVSPCVTVIFKKSTN